jgi:hypothetical protein
MAQIRRGRLLRRIGMAFFCALLLAALLGRLGVRTATATASADGYEVTVEYAAATRPGLATPFSVEVTHPGGFDAATTIAVSGDFLDMFDENGLDPDPAAARADADFVYWTFEAPPGDTLGVSFDARVEPALQWKREGVVKLIQDNRTIVTIPFRSWVMP